MAIFYSNFTVIVCFLVIFVIIIIKIIIIIFIETIIIIIKKNFGHTRKTSFLTSKKEDQVARIGVRGGEGGFRWFGQCPKENVFLPLTPSLIFKRYCSSYSTFILFFGCIIQLPDRDICTFFVSSLLLFHWDLVCCTSPEIFHSRLLFLFFLATDVFPVELVQFPRNKNTSSI